MKEEYEINLRDLLLSGLLAWRWLLVAALVFAVIFGARQAVKKIVVPPEESAETAEAAEPMTDQQLEKAIREYELKKDFYQENLAQQKQNITFIEGLIDSYEEDLEKMEEEKARDYQLQLDPYHMYVSTLTIYLTVQEMNPYSSGDLITPGIGDRIRAVYYNALFSMDLSQFAEELGISAQELGKMISISAGDNGTTLNVRVESQDAGFGEKVLEAMKDTAGKAFQEASTYGYHEIRFSDILSREYLDKDICTYQVNWVQKQEEVRKKIQDQMIALTGAKKTLMEILLDEPVDPLETQAELELAANGEVVEVPVVYRRSTAKEILKQLLFGFFVGLFVCYLVIIFFYILGGKILSTEYPCRAARVRDLGTLSAPYLIRHKTPLDWFLLTRLRRTSRIDAALEERLFRIELEKALPQSGTILFDGIGKQAIPDRMKTLVQSWFPKLRFAYANEIYDNPEILSNPGQYQGVVFALTARKASLNDLEREIEACRKYQMEMLGVVMGE